MKDMIKLEIQRLQEIYEKLSHSRQETQIDQQDLYSDFVSERI